ncbi:MAG TPA: sulfotransferase [Solirubrobacteraceae bacterium]|jgi:hypothetical protein
MKILYLGAYPRSGSTLLSRVLGEADGAICIGETRYLWDRGLINNVDCGCGAPFRTCAFWQAVGQEAFGGWERLDARELCELDRRTNLPQMLPFHFAPTLKPGMKSMIARYTDVLASLYAAIAQVSGARLIVEMSKDPTFACLLRRMPAADVRVVHLIRDSRAVAHSWTRRRRMPSPIGAQEFMSRSTPTHAAIRWLAWNGGFHMLHGAGFPYLKLRYESFVRAPRPALARLSAFAGEDLLPGEAQLQAHAVRLGAHHIFSGNPMRAHLGWVALELDEEWQTGLAAGDRAKVTAMTLPLLAAYGYPLSGKRIGARARAG